MLLMTATTILFPATILILLLSSSATWCWHQPRQIDILTGWTIPYLTREAPPWRLYKLYLQSSLFCFSIHCTCSWRKQPPILCQDCWYCWQQQWWQRWHQWTVDIKSGCQHQQLTEHKSMWIDVDINSLHALNEFSSRFYGRFYSLGELWTSTAPHCHSHRQKSTEFIRSA